MVHHYSIGSKKYMREYMRIYRKTHLNTNKLNNRRLLLIEKLGNKCEVCGEKDGRLVLHHKIYGLYGKHHINLIGWHATKKSIEEAEEFPERFSVLCGTCHVFVTNLENNSKRLNYVLAFLGYKKDCPTFRCSTMVSLP